MIGRAPAAAARTCARLAVGIAALTVAGLALGGCTGTGGGPRAAPSSLGCMRAALADAVAPGLPDKRAHCLAAQAIARRCSVAEARLAAWGKEFTDAFDGGDPDPADLRADRAGIACARAGTATADAAACCLAAGY